MLLERRTAANGKCRAATKAGRQCAAPVIRGDVYCALHSDPKKAAELGRKGGTANRHTLETRSQEVVPPESVGDVKRMLAQTMENVLAGKVDPKLGTTMAYLGIALLRAYELNPAHFEAAGVRRSPYLSLCHCAFDILTLTSLLVKSVSECGDRLEILESPVIMLV